MGVNMANQKADEAIENKNKMLNEFFIDILSMFLFFAFQLDYLLTYLGVKILKIAKEINPFTDIFLNISQRIAIPIRIILVLSIIMFINFRLKHFLKINNYKTIKILIVVLSLIMLILFLLHSFWIINFMTIIKS